MAGFVSVRESLALVFMVFVSNSLGLTNVPFFLWSNDRDVALPSENEVYGHDTSISVVTDHLENYIKSSNPTIVFLQDKLSFDDLAKYGKKPFGSKPSIFENLQQLFKTKTKTIIPSVTAKEEEESVISSLKKKYIGQLEEVYSSDIDSWKYENAAISGKQLFIFHLTPLKGSTEKGKMTILSRNDDVLGKIVAQFGTHTLYTAILTASEPSEIVERMQNDENDGVELKRHLLSVTPSLPGQLFKLSDCVYVYANSIKVTMGNSSAEMINASATVSGKCANNQSTISIVFNKNLPGTITQFDLRMTFVQLPNTDWACSTMDVTYSGKLNGSELTGTEFSFPKCPSKLTAPKAMSYSCGNLVINSVNSTMKLALGHFQVQPFGIKDKRFSNAYDCVDFFTAPILTGLFVTAILLSILFGGIFAVMGISTMDRFDDPKGPTIQVPHE